MGYLRSAEGKIKRVIGCGFLFFLFFFGWLSFVISTCTSGFCGRANPLVDWAIILIPVLGLLILIFLAYRRAEDND